MWREVANLVRQSSQCPATTFMLHSISVLNNLRSLFVPMLHDAERMIQASIGCYCEKDAMQLAEMNKELEVIFLMHVSELNLLCLSRTRGMLQGG